MAGVPSGTCAPGTYLVRYGRPLPVAEARTAGRVRHDGAPNAVVLVGCRACTYARGMEQSEVVKRVIGILTEAGEMRRLLEESPDRGDPSNDSTVVTALLNETMPRIAIPEDATIEDVVGLVGREVGGAVEQLVGAFTLAFAMLAQVHDSGQTDVSSADVLQDLALRAEQFGTEGPGETEA
ncbi:hypothetical protein EDD95_6015 [Streptomyces sp. CEV 2-1]|nr:hypothetical protein EDD95_6015 [Streptomyces sp. CEV 2-1]